MPITNDYNVLYKYPKFSPHRTVTAEDPYPLILPVSAGVKPSGFRWVIVRVSINAYSGSGIRPRYLFFDDVNGQFVLDVSTLYAFDFNDGFTGEFWFEPRGRIFAISLWEFIGTVINIDFQVAGFGMGD